LKIALVSPFAASRRAAASRPPREVGSCEGSAPAAATLAAVLASGVAIALLGFSDGGYFEDTWPVAIVGLAATSALVAVVAPGLRATRAAVAVVAGLLLLAGWETVSALWSLEPHDSLREAERLLVYLAAVGALTAVSRGGARALLGGVLAGTTVVPWQGALLSKPLGYTNALGVLAALGLVIGIGLAFTVRSNVLRAALVASAAVAALTLVLTASRGAAAAGAIGGATAVVFAASASPRMRVGWLGLQALLVGAVLASPLAFDPATLAGRLTDRPYFWWAAWKALPDRPLLGSGAGTYDLLWAAAAPIPVSVQDAHSLYLETLVELGPLGLALILVALLAPAAAAVRTTTRVSAVAAGAYVTFLVHAGIDWDWEMPAVTVAGLACGAAILAERPSTARVADRSVLGGSALLLAIGTLLFILER
jgi:hypothetical protein